METEKGKMTREEFRNFAANRPVFLDGAMGTNLYAAGLKRGVCPEKWILEHPQVVLDLQRAYVEAGTQILYAPTFGANVSSLEKFGLAGEADRMNRELLALTKKAAGGKAFAAGDLAPTGMILEDLGGDNTEEEIFDVYARQVKVLAEEGADLLVVETQMCVDEALLALKAAREVCDLPVMTTLTADPSGRCLFGGRVADNLKLLQDEGADAIGINCCSGPDKVLEIVEEIKKIACVPVIAKPNAGLPKTNAAGQTVYDMGAEKFAGHMKSIYEAGADLIGGCCGTTPAFIKALKDHLS